MKNFFLAAIVCALFSGCAYEAQFNQNADVAPFDDTISATNAMQSALIYIPSELMGTKSYAASSKLGRDDELKISLHRGLDKYDLMLGCVDLIEPSFGFVRTFRVPFLSYERFLKLQEILKFLLLFVYVAGVFLTIKFGFVEAAIYAAAGIFAILIASKLVVARRLDGRVGLRLRDCLLLRGRDDTGAAVFFCIRPSRAEREALRIYFLKNFSYDIKA